MTTNCVFDPKYNIVAVDPDGSSVVQIPGSEFQAVSTSDAYYSFCLFSNFNPKYNDWRGTLKPVDGEYVLGFAPETNSRYSTQVEPYSSCVFRAKNVHVSTMRKTNSYQMTIDPKYDPYIEYTDFTAFENQSGHFSAEQYTRGWIRFMWQKMKDDGIYFPSSDVLTTLNFDIEVFINGHDAIKKIAVFSGTDQLVPMPFKGPFSAPMIIPVRAQIDELFSAGRP